MANWRKTKRKGKLTTTQNSSGKSSISKRVISSSNNDVNLKIKDLKETIKTGRDKFKKNIAIR